MLDEEWIVGAPTDRVLDDRQLGRGVDEFVEQRAGSLLLIAVANPVGQQAGFAAKIRVID